jgi:hypothetical protein
MDEKKPKGIKLNASQLPLSNKADFVIGADGRKVLTNKILENLNNSGNHGYFPSSLNREYKAWSVSRELEIPTLPEESEAQMRMIEGANAEEPLQNEFVSGHEQAEIGWEQQPEFASGREQQTDIGWDQQPEFVGGHEQEEEIEPSFGAGSSFAHEFGAPRSSHAEFETTSGEVSDPTPDSPSPWSGPVTEAQPPIVVPTNQTSVEQNVQVWSESPWAGPVLNEQSIQGPDSQTVQDPNHSVGESRLEAGAEVGVPNHATEGSASSLDEKASLDGTLLPSWMSEMASATVDSAGVESSQDDAVAAAKSMATNEVDEAKEAEALETFLNSIPDEQFIIDNEVMRHLFASLCEPKITKKVKPAANQATAPSEIVIPEAAAEILHSEFPIDAIKIEDVAAGDASALESETSRSSTQGVDFEAIQQAYAMLDLTPLPQIRKTEASLDSVFDMVEKAATESSPDAVSSEGTAKSGLQGKSVQGSSSISRSERGTIEMATHANGRQLIPHYNNCGMLTGVELSEGVRFALSEEKKTWQMIDASGKVMTSGVKSVSFDKRGNLSYVTSGGDTIVLKTDGSIDTIYAKKEKAAEDKSAEKAKSTKDLELQAANENTKDFELEVANEKSKSTVKAKPATVKAKAESVTGKSAKSATDKAKPAAKTVAKPEPKPEPKPNKSAAKSSAKKPKKTR